MTSPTATGRSTPVAPSATPPDDRLPPGLFRVGSRLYAVCRECRGVVRVNKPVLGSLHLCLPDVIERWRA